MTSVHLTEGDRPVLHSIPDALGETLQRSGAVSATRVAPGQWELSGTTKVGVVAVGGVTIWIRPKVAMSRILFLLGYARRPGWREDSVLLSDDAELLPAIADAFVDQAERALERGVLQGYTEVNDSLTVLRGRLREQEQVRRRFGIAIPLQLRFDEHTIDIAENRILRAAAEVLLRLPGLRASTRSRLRGLRQPLLEVSPIPPGASAPSWMPNRLNQRYQVALWLAELILRRGGVDQHPGDVRVGGFLVDMAKVYEDFLTAALSAAFERHGGRSRPQDKHSLDVDERVTLRPDLVWYQAGVPAAVIDAKYKVERPAGFPEADLYQMLAYCTALGLADGHLVYAKGNAEETSYKVRHAGVSIRAHTLDLSMTPADLLLQVEAIADRIVEAARASTTRGATHGIGHLAMQGV